MYKFGVNPCTKKYQIRDFYMPVHKYELVKFLKARGMGKLKHLSLQQLRAIYYKIRMNESRGEV